MTCHWVTADHNPWYWNPWPEWPGQWEEREPGHVITLSQWEEREPGQRDTWHWHRGRHDQQWSDLGKQSLRHFIHSGSWFIHQLSASNDSWFSHFMISLCRCHVCLLLMWDVSRGQIHRASTVWLTGTRSQEHSVCLRSLLNALKSKQPGYDDTYTQLQLVLLTQKILVSLSQQIKWFLWLSPSGSFLTDTGAKSHLWQIVNYVCSMNIDW